MRTLLPAAAALFGLSMIGTTCGPSPGPPPTTTVECVEGLPAPADGDAALILGRLADAEFVPLASGDALTLHYGDQGGQHVYAGVRQYNPGPGGTWVYAFELVPTTGSAGTSQVALEACGPGWTQSQSPVFMDTGEPTEGTLRVVATDEAGAELTAEIAVKIQ
ncbi:MAG: hypothetical protein IT372_31780 [Polyangiaceae bacterium]|nr:hypothetical protein [Polyangiaceae bacterium]